MSGLTKTAFFGRFTIDMTLEQAKGAKHISGAMKAVLKNQHIRRQLDLITDQDLNSELIESDYYSEKLIKLADRELNEMRIIWMAADIISARDVKTKED